MKAIYLTRKATIFALLFVSLLTGSIANPEWLGSVFARPTSHNPKLAEDLENGNWANYESNGNQAPVIIQTSGVPSNSLKQNITGNGGAIKKQFANFNMIAADLPPG